MVREAYVELIVLSHQGVVEEMSVDLRVSAEHKDCGGGYVLEV